jgi:hypothetical protein
MAKKKPDPLLAQAQNASIVRYGPEVSALTALLRQAEEDRDLRLRQAKSGREFAVGAVSQAVPAVRQAYRGAAQAVNPAFAAGGGVEAQALAARMAESQALASSQLAARRVSAIEGEGAARGAALRDFKTDRGKIGQRYLDLAREQGAFVAGTVGDLRTQKAAAKAQAKADRAAAQSAADALNARLTQDERNSIRSAGLNPDAPLPGGGYAPIPGGSLDPKAKPKGKGKGGGWATQEAQAAAGDEIQRLIREAKANKAAGESRHDVADFLLTGAPAGKQPVYEVVPDGKGGKKRQKKLVRDSGGNLVEATTDDPGFTAAKSQLLAQAALDMAYDGHLSRATEKLLHARKVKIKPLGLVTFNEWLKTPAGKAWKARQAGSYVLPMTGRQGPVTSHDQLPG